MMKPSDLSLRAAGALLGAVLAGAAGAATTVYVPLGDANQVLVIDAGSDQVVRRIDDVINPHGLAVTPDGKRLLAGSISKGLPGAGATPPKPEAMSEEAHQRHHGGGGAAGGGMGMGGGAMGGAMTARSAGKGAAGGHVALIRAADGTIERRIPVIAPVHHTAIAPDGRLGFATHPAAGGVSVIDLARGEVVATVATGPGANYVVVSADGSRVYVSNSGNATVSEIDADGWRVRRTIGTGAKPGHMVLSADGRMLFVNNAGDGTISFVSLDKGRSVASYPVGAEPHGVDLSDDGGTLFVSSRGEDRLTAIEVASGRRRAVALGPAPYHVAAVRGTGKLYVSSRERPLLWVLDQRSLEVLGEIPIGGTGHQMAIATQ